MKTIHIPSKAIDALEKSITRAVQNRIETDPYVEDTYLRIGIHKNCFTAVVLYIEESNASQPNRDVALLDLMYNTHLAPDREDWVPDPVAIRELAESYSELIEFNVCQN